MPWHILAQHGLHAPPDAPHALQPDHRLSVERGVAPLGASELRMKDHPPLIRLLDALGKAILILRRHLHPVEPRIYRVCEGADQKLQVEVSELHDAVALDVNVHDRSLDDMPGELPHGFVPRRPESTRPETRR